jgi:hypothetical protein
MAVARSRTQLPHLGMNIDPLAPRYYLEIKPRTRVVPKCYRYEIWEKLGLALAAPNARPIHDRR